MRGHKSIKIMCKHSEELVNGTENQMEATTSNVNENGFNHSAEHTSDAIGVDFEKIENYVQDYVNKDGFENGKYSELVEHLYVGLSKKELAVMAGEGVLNKVRQSRNPLAALMASSTLR